MFDQYHSGQMQFTNDQCYISATLALFEELNMKSC